MAHFDLIQSIGLAGDSGHANDDRAGTAARLAWVIDGATDLGPPGLMGTQAGAAWLATTADRAFAASSQRPLSEAVTSVFGALALGYEAERVREPAGRWELPSAAFLAVALGDGRLELAWLADCACLLVRKDRSFRLGPLPTAFETEEARTARAAGLDLALPSRPASTTEQLRRNRDRPDRRVLGVEAACAADVHFAQAEVRPGDELLLMTDGLAALIDDYGMPAPDFITSLRRSGLHDLAACLRKIEAEDASGARFPRFKRSDDATALWLRVAR